MYYFAAKRPYPWIFGVRNFPFKLSGMMLKAFEANVSTAATSIKALVVDMEATPFKVLQVQNDILSALQVKIFNHLSMSGRCLYPYIT